MMTLKFETLVEVNLVKAVCCLVDKYMEEHAIKHSELKSFNEDEFREWYTGEYQTKHAVMKDVREYMQSVIELEGSEELHDEPVFDDAKELFGFKELYTHIAELFFAN